MDLVADLLAKDFTSRQAPAWSTELRCNPAVWLPICEEWTRSLQQVLDGQVTGVQETIRTVRQMRAIKFAQREDCHATWKDAVKVVLNLNLVHPVLTPAV
jgi:hypothetical protein